MKTAVIEINPDWKAALKAGAKGMRQAAKSRRVQQATFSYASTELLFSEISPKRWGVLEAMSGAGEMSLRELAAGWNATSNPCTATCMSCWKPGCWKKPRVEKSRAHLTKCVSISRLRRQLEWLGGMNHFFPI